MSAACTVVVGAGLAGLACAIHLAGSGRDVLVVEAGSEPGGCCRGTTVAGYRFDTGPAVLTMPDVLAGTAAAAGEELDRWLPLDALDPYYRLTFPDHTRLDIVPGAERMEDRVRRLAGPREALRYRAFRQHLRRMHEAEWSAFVDRDFDSVRDLVQSRALLRLARLGGFRSVQRLAERHLTDWRVVRAHTFQSLYVGLSPYEALGIYGVVSYMDTVGGVYFPRHGGMRAVPTALADLARKAGAHVRYDSPVERVHADSEGVRGVRLSGGEEVPARDVVVTSDLARALTHMLPPRASDWRVRRRQHYAPSCYVTHLGLNRRLPGQAHHTIHFGQGWKSTFAALADGHPQPASPNLLVTYPTDDDPESAPPGRSVVSVLEPTANLTGGHDWSTLGPQLRDRAFARLAALGYPDLAGDSAVELAIDPPAWAQRGYTAGTPFATDHRFSQTGWFRHAISAARIPGLHFAGMGTRPGVGVPMVLISGRLAAARVLGDRR